MANKPAKKNITNSSTPVKKKNEGDIVMYIGMTKGIMNSCPVCGGKTSKGILRQYKNELYCSKRCAVSVIEKDEGND
jgi:hypothetical protein